MFVVVHDGDVYRLRIDREANKEELLQYMGNRKRNHISISISIISVSLKRNAMRMTYHNLAHNDIANRLYVALVNSHPSSNTCHNFFQFRKFIPYFLINKLVHRLVIMDIY